MVLINDDGLVFAAERLDLSGAYQMPQGGIDAGETPRAAALRELREETSVPESAVEVLAISRDWIRYDLPDHLLGKVWKGRYRGQQQKWLLCRLITDDAVIDLATDHPEFARWKWMTADALAAQIVPFKRDLYRAVFAEFAPHLA